jgi:hypothetical protein
MQVACQRQFIESAQLYPVGNCRGFRNPDRSENEGCWFQFFRSSDTIGEVGGFAYGFEIIPEVWMMDHAAHLRGTAKRLTWSSSWQPNSASRSDSHAASGVKGKSDP